MVAECLKEAEGWAWATGRMEAVSYHGEDAMVYRIQDEPEAVYTEQEQQRLDELQDLYDENQTASDETDVMEAEMAVIGCAAQVGRGRRKCAHSLVWWCHGVRGRVCPARRDVA